jgi:tRNA modification GTPase
VGIVRVSGNDLTHIFEAVLGFTPKPRHAYHCEFFDVASNGSKQVIDIGIALYFEAPHSFTGEHVLELQGHGGPVILDLLIKHLLTLGVRVARPGEFSERAFLNDKLDLTQAEAIADLIEASSEQAARKALNSLQGAFSKQIQELLERLIVLRIHVEAAIDFPEEEIDFLADEKIAQQLTEVTNSVSKVRAAAKQGAIIREGLHIVIVGKPNAGKSSLLNALAEKDSAIVTDIPGTTRDVLREEIQIDGIPVHITDTAGLRESDDLVEQIGIERAAKEVEKADVILLMVDASEANSDTKESNSTTQVDANLAKLWPEVLPRPNAPITVIQNKIDKINDTPISTLIEGERLIKLSALTGEGLELLKDHLKQLIGYDENIESNFMARRRHLDALDKVSERLVHADQQLTARAGELLAEELRLAQNELSEITGEFTSDDLLGRIFSSFCIGK